LERPRFGAEQKGRRLQTDRKEKKGEEERKNIYIYAGGGTPEGDPFNPFSARKPQVGNWREDGVLVEGGEGGNPCSCRPRGKRGHNPTSLSYARNLLSGRADGERRAEQCSKRGRRKSLCPGPKTRLLGEKRIPIHPTPRSLEKVRRRRASRGKKGASRRWGGEKDCA